MAFVTVSGGQQWELGETIGAGGIGRVHVATSDSQEAAIKLVPKAPGALRELLVNNDLRGVPNVVPVLDTGQTETHWALLMPRADLSLRQYIDQASGPVPEAQALPILIDIARALAGLATGQGQAAGGVVHRDLKPENVLRLDGSWCLTDFGIARYATAATGPDTRRYFMSHEYAAPEQWRGETATAETDVYALGVIAFELLIGSRPFTGPDLREQHLLSAVPPITGVAPHLAAIIEECLYKEPGTRPLPDRLTQRLERQAAAPSVRDGGLRALQQANLAETVRHGQEGLYQVDARMDADRRVTLLEVATRQFEQIRVKLNDTIVSNAPNCAPLHEEWPGLELMLNEALLGLFGPWSVDEQLRRKELEDAVYGRRPRRDSPKLPFDVIASGFVAVSKTVEEDLGYGSNEHGYLGRAHALWFCDAQVKGRYAWYETAFAKRDAGSTKHDDRCYFVDVGDGEYIPFAVTPTEDQALSALTEHLGEYGHPKCKVTWPFMPLDVGDLDEFIDRWINWFAAASQGLLPHPSNTPMPDPHGSWR